MKKQNKEMILWWAFYLFIMTLFVLWIGMRFINHWERDTKMVKLHTWDILLCTYNEGCETVDKPQPFTWYNNSWLSIGE